MIDVEGRDICEFCNEPIGSDEPEVTVPTGGIAVGVKHYHVIGGCAAKKIWELEGRGKASKERNLEVKGKEPQTQEELDDF